MTDALILLSIFDAASLFNYFVEHASYWFVFLFMVIESSFIPFPSEVVVPPAAYLAIARPAESDMNIYMIVVFATVGALVGSLINYYLSLWIGRPLVYAFANSRFGHACLIDQTKVEKAEAYFDKNGAISTFVGRFIPAIRQLISIPAGLAKMNIGAFCLYTTLGAGIWNCILASLGWWLAKAVPYNMLLVKIEEYNQYLTYAGIALGVICVGIILYNAMKSHKKAEK